MSETPPYPGRRPRVERVPMGSPALDLGEGRYMLPLAELKIGELLTLAKAAVYELALRHEEPHEREAVIAAAQPAWERWRAFLLEEQFGIPEGLICMGTQIEGLRRSLARRIAADVGPGGVPEVLRDCLEDE